MNKQRKISNSVKMTVVGRQRFKCANGPGSNLDKLETYLCPFWQATEYTGSFDESGYVMDHKKEFCSAGYDDISNLQALCVCCQSVKITNTQIEKEMRKRHELKHIEYEEILERIVILENQNDKLKSKLIRNKKINKYA